MISAHEIDKVIEKRGKSREHLMLVLRDVEALSGNGQVDVPVLETVADRMNIPRSAVAGFISFYSMFNTAPRAKHIIRVCKSGPCHVMGSRTIFDVLESYLGVGPAKATPDGLFYVEEAECLGVCSAAPAFMIDFDIYGNLTEVSIKEILESYRTREPSPAARYGAAIEGKACIIDEVGQTKRLIEKVGRVDPENIESYMKEGGYGALKKALAEYGPDDVLAIVKASGLRGRGGAGFPAGVKWSFVPKGNMQKYVICNADEGEPGTFKDRVLMEENPHLVIEGMALCGYVTGAQTGYIYVRGEYRRSIDRLQKAIDDARAKGMLGPGIAGSNFSFDVFIKEGGGSYVCGEESSLMNSMEGKRGYPRFRPPFPAGAGFLGKPSNVNNVETYASVPLIVANGAEWYRSVGTSSCAGTKLYCLSGRVNRTGLLELPMGTTLRQIIDVYGKGMKDGKAFKFAQVGGSAGGILGPDLMDLPLDIDSTLKAGVTLGSGAVLVCDEDTCPVDFLKNVLDFFEHESCGQCVPCRVGTKHLHYLARKFAAGKAVPADMDAMIEKAEVMKNSLCALGQSPILPIRTMLKHFKEEFVKHCDPEYRCAECSTTLTRQA